MKNTMLLEPVTQLGELDLIMKLGAYPHFQTICSFVPNCPFIEILADFWSPDCDVMCPNDLRLTYKMLRWTYQSPSTPLQTVVNCHSFSLNCHNLFTLLQSIYYSNEMSRTIISFEPPLNSFSWPRTSGRVKS